MTVRAMPRRQTSSETAAKSTIIAIAASADTGSSAENSAPTSAVASTENKRNGARTLKFSRARTGRAPGPSTPVRPAIQPTSTARAMTANPVKIWIMRASPPNGVPSRRSSASTLPRAFGGRRRGPDLGSECTLSRTVGETMAGAVEWHADPDDGAAAASVPLEVVDAWWRAANYLSVGQIYLMGNALLTRPLEVDDVKPRLLGHWGTSPGLNLVYAHLN